MNLEELIGTQIRNKREQKHIKLESLAKHIGVSKARMSQIEHGQCKELTIARIQKIADYLDVNFLEIVNIDLQEIEIKNSKNLNAFNDSNNHITPELIKSLADELVHRLKS